MSFDVYHGTYAELFVVPAAFAVVVDPSVPDEHVAAFPNTYITAWQMLHRVARVRTGQTILMLGANGGVGSTLV